MTPDPPLILTLRFDPRTFAVLDGLRQQHFPAARNVVPAHVTLFHALPADREPAVRDALTAACAVTPPVSLFFPAVRSLGKGVAVVVDAPELVRLRRELASGWTAFLTPQDRQGYRPHVTVQNKVTPDEARRLYQQLSGDWTPFAGTGDGLLLWRYMGGPWEPAGAFPFTG